MKVFFPNYNKEFENTDESITEIIEEVNGYLLNSDNHMLSHLNVDGVNVHINHHQYLLDGVSTINEIKVIIKTKQEMIAELQGTLNDYLVRALPVIDGLSNKFYQGESDEVWNEFVDFSDGLQWINSAVVTLTNFSEEATMNYYQGVSERLEASLQELFNALEMKDTVTIADIIQYEIIETLTELKQTVHH